jgi:ParB-like chromosome segregation protein Spo0J
MNAVELTPHPAALRFPALSEQDYAALKLDIQTSGQLHPVVINERNEILDGVHRVRACQELGLAPAVIRLADVLGEKQVTEIEFIFSANFHRRHLSDDQRIAVCAAFLPELREQAQKNLKSTLIHGRRKGGAPIRERRFADNAGPKKKGGVRTALADMANVGTGRAQRAITLADRNPELLARVSRGEKSLNEAHREFVAGQHAPDTDLTSYDPPPSQSKVEQWLDKLLTTFEPEHRAEVLRLVAEVCRVRLEKL